MKKTVFTIALVFASSSFAAFAQDSAASASQTPTPTQGWHARGGHMRGVWKSLTPEERQKLKSARQASQNDPAVVQARKNMVDAVKAFRETRRAAMLKADPTIAPILDKFKAAKTGKDHNGI